MTGAVVPLTFLALLCVHIWFGRALAAYERRTEVLKTSSQDDASDPSSRSGRTP